MADLMTDDQWFYARGNQQQGPVGIDDLRRLIAAGQIGPGDLVWRDGLPNWQAVASTPELLPPVAPSAPPAPAATPGSYESGPIPYNQPLGYQNPADPVTRQLQSQASTALVVGILSLVLSGCVCGPVGLGLGIWAWVTGGKVPEGYPFSGQARAGMICGIIGTVLGGLSSIFHVLWAIGAVVGAL